MQDQGSNRLETMARLGFGARGAVYCLVGALALTAAMGWGGETTGSRGALRTLLGQPSGRLLLAAVALGLFFFALWRVIEALSDADGRGRSLTGLAQRGGHLISGLIYGGLGYSALSLALGWGGGGTSEDQAARDWTAWLMQQPFGRWAVGAVGVAIAGAGLAFLWKGWKGNVADRLDVSHRNRRWIIPLGRVGFAARGLVFAIIGAFVLVAAIQARSSQVRGLGGALETLEGQSFGRVLLAATAAGLIAFGVFGFVQARYRRIHAPDPDRSGEAVKSKLRSAGLR